MHLRPGVSHIVNGIFVMVVRFGFSLRTSVIRRVLERANYIL